jgi:peptidoglycan-N-acetylmuramic acid deacetylase
VRRPLQANPCDKPVYLTFDTGHMGVAPLVAGCCKRSRCRSPSSWPTSAPRPAAGSLGTLGALVEGPRRRGPRLRLAHLGPPHWLADRPDGGFASAVAGPQAGQAPGAERRRQYCTELQRPADRFQAITGQPMLPLFRAPGGKTSPRCWPLPRLRLAACGLGAGRLPGRRTAQRQATPTTGCCQALRDIRAGDILVAHLGIWSRKTLGAGGAGAADQG